MFNGSGWILEVDIRKFFDTLDHAHLRELLRQRVRDGVVLRLIGKWLNAGVMEGGAVTYPSTGSPQGGVISPLLANVYLHYVLDVWWQEAVEPRLAGRASLSVTRTTSWWGSPTRRTHDERWRCCRSVSASTDWRSTRTRRDWCRSRGPRAEGTGGTGVGQPTTWDVRLPGVHHYWGKSRKNNAVVKKRTQPANPPVRESDRGMVSAKPTPTDQGTARDAEPETTRSRRLLRGDGERLLAEPYEGDRGADLAEVAFQA